MGLERKLERLEDIVEKFNDSTDNSLGGKFKRTLYLGYVVNVGGASLPIYQRRLAKRIGWKEEDLTFANATIFGLGTTALYFSTVYLGFSEFDDSIQNILYTYPGFNFFQSLFRMGYSKLFKKALPSISLSGGVGSTGYMIEDLVEERKKPAEGVEPPT